AAPPAGATACLPRAPARSRDARSPLRPGAAATGRIAARSGPDRALPGRGPDRGDRAVRPGAGSGAAADRNVAGAVLAQPAHRGAGVLLVGMEVAAEVLAPGLPGERDQAAL